MNCLRCDAEVEITGKINECSKCEFAWLIDADKNWSAHSSDNVTWYWNDWGTGSKRMPEGCLLVVRDYELSAV